MSRSFRLPISGRMFGAMLVLVALMLMAPFISGTSLADTGDGDDMTPPVLTIISPTDGSVTNSKEVTWTIIEDGSGIKNYQYKIGDGDSWTDIDDIDLSAFSYTFANLVEGENTLHIKVIDHADNEGYAQVTFFVDTTPPILTIDPLENDGYFNINGVTITWSITDDGVADIDHFKVRIKSYGGDWLYGSEEIADESFTFNDLVDGKYVAEVRAIDNAGNSVTAMVIFTVDTVKPVPAITSPAGESFTNSKTVSWSATDEGSGIAGYQYKLDDGEWSENTTATSHTFTDLADGEHTVHVRVYDHAGNYDDTSVTFTLDTVPPTLTIGSPENGDFVDSSTVEVSWTGDDDRSDVVSYQCRIHSNGAWSNWHDTEGADHFSFTDLIEGEHIVQVRIYDQAGNFAEKSVTFTVDTEEPVLNIDSPADGSFLNNPDVPISWSATDVITAVTGYEYRIHSNGAWSEWSERTTATGHTFPSLADGTHKVQVRAYDQAGNFAEKSIEFTVDTVYPVLTIESPEGSFTNSKTVEWSATDDRSGIVGYKYKLDDGGWSELITATSYIFASLVDGTHTVHVCTYDRAGNFDEKSVTFTLDTIGPVLTITSPVEGKWVTTADVEITCLATDDGGSGIRGYRYSTDGNSWSEETTDPSYVFHGLGQGANTVYVKVIDNAGNEATTSISFLVDSVLPGLAVSSPALNFISDLSSVVFVWSGGDSGSGLAGFRYSLDGINWSDLSYAVNVAFHNIEDGPRQFYIRAHDLAGNVREVIVPFTVDVTAPDISIESPGLGDFIGSDKVTVVCSAEDPSSGIKEYRFRLNGGPWQSVSTSGPSASYQFDNLHDGMHIVEVQVIDNADNVAMSSVTFIVDTAEPILEIESPNDDAYLSSKDVTVSWSATDDGSGIADFQYSTDGGVTWSPTTTGSFHSFTNLGEGKHTVYVKAIDRAGNEAIVSVTFTVDTTKPTLTITSPDNNDYFKSKNVTVSWTATDASGVKGVQYQLDGGPWSVMGMSTERKFVGLAEGSHTVHVRAIDNAGNEVETSITFIVDTIVPNLTITSPSNNAYTKDKDIEVTWTLSDASGVKELQYKHGDSDWIDLSLDVRSLPFVGLAEGSHTVQVRAVDGAGNEIIRTVTFNIDITGPTLTITSPSIGDYRTSSAVTVIWSGEDNSGVVSYRYKLNNGNWSEPTSATSYTFLGLADKEHIIYIEVRDIAGNINEKSVTFTVDTTKPTLTITSPSNNAYLNTSKDVTITWTAIDDGSKIKNIQYRINGGEWYPADVPGELFKELIDGEYIVEIMAFDNAGHSAIASVKFVVDTEPSSLVITSPSPGFASGQNKVWVTWFSHDITAGLLGYQYSTDGGATWSDITMAFGHEFTELGDGQHTVHIRAIDRAGLITDEESVTFTVDTTKPTLTIDPLGNDGYFKSKDVTVSWEGDGGISGIAGYQYKLDGSIWSEITSATSHLFTNLGEGQHTLLVRAIDGADNRVIEAVTFTVDTVDPIVKISSPEISESDGAYTMTVKWSAEDLNSGIDRYEVSLDGNNWAAPNGDMAHVFGGTGEVPSKVYVRAFDKAENSATAEASTSSGEGPGPGPYLGVSVYGGGNLFTDDDVTVIWSLKGATFDLDHYEVRLSDKSWLNVGTDPYRDFIDLPDGVYIVEVRAIPTEGSALEGHITFTVDTTPPALEITSPNGGSASDYTMVVVACEASDATSGLRGLQYRLGDGDSWSDLTLSATYTLSSLDNGVYTVHVRAVDVAGNEVIKSVTFIVDTELPKPIITSPSNTAHLGSKDVTVSWGGDGGISGIAGYQYRINSGGVWSEWSEQTAATSHTFTNLGEGPHIVEVRAYDGAGNFVMASVIFAVDTADPILSITSPLGTGPFSSDDISITWTGYDAISGIAGYRYSIDGGVTWDDTSATSHVFEGLADGTYVVKVRAFDTAGNYVEESFTFIVDTSKPSVSITSPEELLTNSSSVKVEWSAEDLTSGILGYRYKLDSGSWSALMSGTSFTFSNLADGAHTVEIMAVDNAGYEGIATVTFTVDTTKPTVMIDSPSNNKATSETSMNVIWTGSDATSGIRGYQYRIGSSGWSEESMELSALFAGLAEGPHTVIVRAYDKAGNYVERSVTFIIDTADTNPPTITIDSPTAGELFGENIVVVRWTGNDVPSGVKGYKYKLNDGAWSENTTMTSHTFTGLADGKHTVQVRAYDLAGNFVEAYVDLFVDTTDPEIIAHTPSGMGVPVDTSISATFSEEMVHDSLVFTISGANGVISWQGNTATFSPYSDLVFGRTYSVSVYGKDLSGNSVTAQWTFTAVPNGTVSGKIVYKDGSPIANATVSSGGKSVTTDANGEFLIDLVKGQHDLIVSLNGKEIGMFNATTVPGEMNDLGELIFYDTDITLRDVLGWIALAALIALLLLLLLLAILRRRSFYVVVNGIMEGKVLDLKDRPIEGAAVILETGQAAVTDAEGGFSLDVTPRTYGMTVEKDGRKSPVFLVTVAPGQTYTSEVKRMEKGN